MRSGQLLNRGPRRVGLADETGDAGDKRFGAGRLCLHHEHPGAVERAAEHAIPRLLGHRQGFAGEQRLIAPAFPFHNPPVDRNPFARPHPQQVACLDRCQGHRFAATGVGRVEPDGLWR